MKEVLGLEGIVYNDNACTATKTIAANAIFFEGHYPGDPAFPGVLQLELAVSAAQLLLESLGYAVATGVKHIKKCRFVKRVWPGEVATIKVKHVKDAEYGQEIAERPFEFEFALFVKDERVSYGTFTLAKKPEPDEYHPQYLYETPIKKTALGALEIAKYIPPRFPFLHVDAILDLVPGQSMRSLKNVSANDYVFWGKEPGMPFPPLVLIEVFAQGGTVMLCQWGDGTPLVGVLSGITFLGNAYPGDQMIVESSLVKAVTGKYIVTGQIKVGNRVILDVENIIAGEGK